jgi:hypothetical protein
MKENKEIVVIDYNSLDVETIINFEKTKLNYVDEILNEYEPQFKALTVKGVDDIQGYENVKNALKLVVKKRNELEDKRVELKANSLKIGRAIDEEANRLKQRFLDIENHLKRQKEIRDAELKRIELEMQQQRERALMQRVAMLSDIGFKTINNGNAFVLSYIELDIYSHITQTEILKFSDNEFNEFYFQNKQQFDLIKEHEKAKLERQKEIERKQAEIERAAKEQKETEKQMKLQMLSMNRIVYNKETDYLFYKGHSIGTYNDLFLNMPMPDFMNYLLVDLQKSIASIDENIIQKEKEEAERLEMQKKQIAEEAIRMENERKKIEAEKQKELEENLSDIEKLQIYYSKIKSIEPPTLKMKKNKVILNNFILFIETLNLK